jgi:hypothetical protein
MLVEKQKSKERSNNTDVKLAVTFQHLATYGRAPSGISFE